MWDSVTVDSSNPDLCRGEEFATVVRCSDITGLHEVQNSCGDGNARAKINLRIYREEVL